MQGVMYKDPAPRGGVRTYRNSSNGFAPSCMNKQPCTQEQRECHAGKIFRFWRAGGSWRAQMLESFANTRTGEDVMHGMEVLVSA